MSYRAQETKKMDDPLNLRSRKIKNWVDTLVRNVNLEIKQTIWKKSMISQQKINNKSEYNQKYKIRKRAIEEIK